MIDELSKLKRRVENCRRCNLWKTRKKSVFGEGFADAEIMLIGLGPGYHENDAGRPFVGAAGKLLNEFLELAGLKRDDVYITNIMKCYLPNNKATEEEIRTCTLFLNKQIEIIKPKIIVLLGTVATKYIFNRFGLPYNSMHVLHGNTYAVSTLFLQTTIIPMYHPSAALRNPYLKEAVRNDWREKEERVRKYKRPDSTLLS